MSIDTSKEEIGTLAYARQHFIPRVNRKPVSPSTVWRWVHHGVRAGSQRVFLETTCVGGQVVTSKEACERFFNAITAGRCRSSALPQEPTERSEATRRRLKKAGLLNEEE